MTDHELRGRPIPVASRACCCPATPVVTVVMPPTAVRRHPADLLLCGHPYRAGQAALRPAGAAVYDRSGTQVMPADRPRQAPVWDSAPADRNRVTR